MIRKPLILTAALCSTIAVSSTVTAQEVTEIDLIMPTPRSNLFYPLVVGEALGYFKDEGVKVNLLPSATTVPYVSFLSNGNADIAMLDGPQTYQAVDAGTTLKVIYEAQQTAPEGVVTSDNLDVNGIEDLVGTTVGLVTDRDRATLAMTLNHVGHSLDDVDMVVLGDGGPTLANALKKEQVTAIAGALPDWIALQANGLTLLDITPKEMAETPANSFVVLEDKIEEMGDLYEGFLRAWSKGAYVTSVDEEVIASMMAEAVPEEWQNPEFGQNYLDGAMPLNYPVTERFGELRPDSWEKVQAEMIRVDELSENHDVSSFLEPRFITAANDFDKGKVENDVAEWRKNNM
ncbi:ABC transporter substrate-binding protein [Halomonas sp. EGI 63088]|uniref:ABC transporter substrate-binding protein n=1 Tax=Halomonas flagellata TaxID=2920385 RepID=A0ABS9RZ80_9GAMM|nr:ABC transporter substrate-binding protein [Halomonas flagellata]MCH4565124.1 ABC transporter substrate-binding protein [Halomonas flagellata]